MLPEKSLNVIWDRYLTEFVSDHFLGQLEQNRRQTDNSNGILFLCMMLMLFREYGKVYPGIQKKLDSIKVNVDHAINSIQVSGQPGLFKRAPGNDSREAHDNYVGIILLSLMFDLKYHKDILERGRYKFKFNKYLGFDSYFNYNNVEPNIFDWKTQRQGGEIALYRMANGQFAGVLFLLWLCVGFLLSAKKENPSSMNLGLLRMFLGMDLIFKKHKFSFITKGIVAITKKLYMKRLEKQEIDIQYGFDHYFQPYHLIHMLTRDLYK